jgi:hypothetical protein
VLQDARDEHWQKLINSLGHVFQLQPAVSCHQQVNLLQGCKGGLLAAGDSHEVMCAYGTCQGMVATAFASSSSSIDDQAEQEPTSSLAWLNIMFALLPCVSPSDR